MRYWLPVLLLLLGGAALRAQDDEVKVTAEGSYTSRYVSRGVEQSRDAMLALVKLERGSLKGLISTNQPFRSAEPSETDASLGYTWQVQDQLAIEASVRQFWFSQVLPGGTRQSQEVGLTLSHAAQSGPTASLSYYRDFRLKADTIESSLGFELPLTKLGAYLELRLFAGWRKAADLLPDQTGPVIRDSYSYYGMAARLPYRISEHTSLVLGGGLAGSASQAPEWSQIRRSGGGKGWASFAVSFDF